MITIGSNNILNHNMAANVSSFIPEVMNCLYDNDVLASTSLIEIRDAFRVKQVAGKQWLIDAIDNHCVDKNKSVLVIGGWFGFTSFCLHKLGFQDITDIDPDHRISYFAQRLNRFNPQFQRLLNDVNQIDTSRYDIVINTSCEHIKDQTWFEKISKGTTVFLQSTDYVSNDHVNICYDLEDMKSRYPLNFIFSDILDLNQYKRFMLIGTK